MMTQRSMLPVEKQHLDSGVRSSHERLDALLCEEFREFGSSGSIRERAEILRSVTSEAEISDYQIDDFQISRLGEDHVLTTYELSARRNSGVRKSLRSSIWKLVNGKWCLLFYQGTRRTEKP